MFYPHMAHARGVCSVRKRKDEPMADDNTENTATDEETPDYKALYEQAKADLDKRTAEARKWESRSKANFDKNKTADERIADLEKKLAEQEKAASRAELANKVASAKNVPADLLVGDTEDEMNAWADKMAAAFKKKPAPSVPNSGKFDGGKTDDSELREFAKKLIP